MSVNKFPPKFRKDILYPSTHNLDQLSIPSQTDDYYGGQYFQIQWDGYGVGAVPTLGFGKHKFNIYLTPYDDTEFVTEPFKKLKSKSTILFEIKDSVNTIIFSDLIPLFTTDQGYSGYIWIKQDPIRTYDDIQEGYGKIRIVGTATTTNSNWKNKPNVRLTQDIDIKLYEDQNIPTYKENHSSIIFQHGTGSMGSGSGLTITETLEQNDTGTVKSVANISSSKMKTYSGQVNKIISYIKVSGSVDDDWISLSTNTLTSSNYENGIHKDYGVGINTLSEQWQHEISTDILSALEYNELNKVKFKLEFYNKNNEIAKDPYSLNEDFILKYPNKVDSDVDGWIDWQGGVISLGNNIELFNSNWSIETGGGHFYFGNEVVNIRSELGGQTFNADGTIKSYGTPGSPGDRSGPSEGTDLGGGGYSGD